MGGSNMICKLSRIRRAVKWSGLAACVAAITIWAATLRVLAGYSGMSCDVYVGGGVLWINSISSKSALGWQTFDARQVSFGGRLVPETGISRSWTSSGQLRRTRYFNIPLWIPVLAMAVPTVWVWRRDRRVPPGYCQSCGYNLTANVSGACPECGTTTSWGHRS